MKVNLRIGTRILAGYGVAVIVVTGVGAIAYRGLTDLVEAADSVARTHEVKAKLSDALATLVSAENAQRGFLLTGEEAYLAPYRTAGAAMERDLRELQELIVDREQQGRLATLQSLMRSRLGELSSSLQLRRRTAPLAAYVGQGRQTMENVRQVAGEMERAENGLLQASDQRARASGRFAMSTILWGGLLVFALVSMAGILVRRSITVPLAAFLQFVARVGEGDLTQKARISRRDELGDLAQGLDSMVTGLKGVAGQTRQATENLNSAAAEILASTQQQAAGTGEQAAAIQQTTTTMEEVRQSGLQIAERAKQVATSAENASAASHAGLEAVENTTRVMEAIREQAEAVAENVVSLSERTQTIGEIIATVNDLAEQSHLLALNAAIEAAAAGEHGRSFSVIAGEVKNLADQSREATIQVRSILGDIQKGINSSVMLTEEAVKRVETGKQQADVADRTIRAMTESIRLSLQAFQQIVAGANQQQGGFTQVMQAVRDIGQATQQSAASTRQLENAAVNLTALARQLQGAVERYRI